MNVTKFIRRRKFLPISGLREMQANLFGRVNLVELDFKTCAAILPRFDG